MYNYLYINKIICIFFMKKAIQPTLADSICDLRPLHINLTE